MLVTDPDSWVTSPKIESMIPDNVSATSPVFWTLTENVTDPPVPYTAEGLGVFKAAPKIGFTSVDNVLACAYSDRKPNVASLVVKVTILTSLDPAGRATLATNAQLKFEEAAIVSPATTRTEEEYVQGVMTLS